MYNIIKIFIASSYELEVLREDFELFILRKNQYLKNSDILLEVIKWEFFMDNISETRKQDDYNKAILDCDFFVSVFYSKAGKYTQEELKTAYDGFKKEKKPEFVYTYFIECEKKEPSVDELISYLKNIGHFQTVADNKEALLLHFGEQLNMHIFKKIQKLSIANLHKDSLEKDGDIKQILIQSDKEFIEELKKEKKIDIIKTVRNITQGEKSIYIEKIDGNPTFNID